LAEDRQRPVGCTSACNSNLNLNFNLLKVHFGLNRTLKLRTLGDGNARGARAKGASPARAKGTSSSDEPGRVPRAPPEKKICEFNTCSRNQLTIQFSFRRFLLFLAMDSHTEGADHPNTAAVARQRRRVAPALVGLTRLSAGIVSRTYRFLDQRDYAHLATSCQFLRATAMLPLSLPDYIRMGGPLWSGAAFPPYLRPRRLLLVVATSLDSRRLDALGIVASLRVLHILFPTVHYFGDDAAAAEVHPCASMQR
jgi:hypothetical protein